MHGTVPEETGERAAMRRLVTYRLRGMHRTRWAAPTLCTIGALVFALDAATGQWIMAGCVAIGGAVFVLLAWMRRRVHRKFHHMDEVLGSDQPSLEH
ncbi:hypothetical protein [Streptomyces sp. NPDC050738]|uniref:hypothetical protein n=1 Tax=Streptomyces sp. NPDC050738 TaxID=3154744 RepID=UPI00342FC786